MFAKIINNVIESYPYNPQSDHPLTSFPVGDSYPAFNCYWVHSTTPNNPDEALYNPVETTPVFNGTNWEQSWEFVEKPVEPIAPNWLHFYKQLKISATYQHLFRLTSVVPNISGVMAALGIAIQDGIRDPFDPDILPAFQAGVSGLLFALNEYAQPLTTEQLEEVRGLLDSNGFTNITLGD